MSKEYNLKFFNKKSIKDMLKKVEDLNKITENEPGASLNNVWEGNVYTYKFSP